MPNLLRLLSLLILPQLLLPLQPLLKSQLLLLRRR